MERLSNYESGQPVELLPVVQHPDEELLAHAAKGDLENPKVLSDRNERAC